MEARLARLETLVTDLRLARLEDKLVPTGAAALEEKGGGEGKEGEGPFGDRYFHEMIEEGLYFSYERKGAVKYSGKSAFQTLELFDATPFGLLLATDGLMQSAECDEFIYHESLVQPAMIAHGKPKRVYIGGGGEGATLREVMRHASVEECMMVDIDGKLVEICKEHMPTWGATAWEDKRSNVIIDDAKKVLEEQPDESFDVIIMDLSDPLDDGPCYLLYTVEFYELCKRKLRSGGVLVTQSGMASTKDAGDGVFPPIHNTLSRVFPKVAPYSQHVPSFCSEWGFNLAFKEARVDAHKMEDVDEKIDAIGLADSLKHYDQMTHNRMFSLPKSVRALLQNDKRVITVDSPLFMYDKALHAGVAQ